MSGHRTTRTPPPRAELPERAPRATPALGVAGLLLLVVGTWWIGFGSAQLGTVLLTQVDVVSDTIAPSASWGVLVVTTALGLLLCTGPPAWVGRVDALQLVGAAWALGCVAVFSALGSGFEFTGPDSHCVYASCWPGRYQQLAITAPLIVACLLMVVMATACRRLSWWFRGLLPAVMFAVLTVVQVAVWDRFVIPLFNAPPPF